VDDHPDYKREVWLKIRGRPALNWLKNQRPQSSKITIEWYNDIIQTLNEELAKI
jgi:hypothetical protein